MPSKPAARTISGTSVLKAMAMTAALATDVAAQAMKMTGTSTSRAVPRSRMVARMAAYSVCRRESESIQKGETVDCRAADKKSTKQVTTCRDREDFRCIVPRYRYGCGGTSLE